MVKGDAYKSETFESEMIEKDAVISCLGPTSYTSIGPFAKTTVYSDTIIPILDAMKKLVDLIFFPIFFFSNIIPK